MSDKVKLMCAYDVGGRFCKLPARWRIWFKYPEGPGTDVNVDAQCVTRCYMHVHRDFLPRNASLLRQDRIS